MTVYIIDPLADPRWDELVHHHECASIFHTRGWLSALRHTYGFKPVLFTTAAPSKPLENGLLFCDVRSCFMGRRLVSLPFSDHCDPLVNSPGEHTEILEHVYNLVDSTRCRYAEVRPVSPQAIERQGPADLRSSQRYYLHVLSLRPPLDVLFRRLHKDCIQRKIRRAEREALHYEKGRSDYLLRKFFQLLVRTRRRHCLPPQPIEWFRYLIASVGDQLTIRLASQYDRPVAAILTLTFNDTITFKYGCSDERFHHLGGTPFLFWKTIQESKDRGMSQLDLGRSDLDNAGLIQFKDRLGAKRMDLTYYRLISRRVQSAWRMGTAPRPARNSHRLDLLKRFVSHLPDAVLVAAGRLLYKHIG